MQSLFADSIKAHAMRFEKPLAPAYGDDDGLRMLAAFLVVAIAMPFALRFALDVAGVRGMPGANLGFVVAWLAAIFGIGLFFGIVYSRSGNVWIPAALHGVWPLNMS